MPHMVALLSIVRQPAGTTRHERLEMVLKSGLDGHAARGGKP